MRVQTHILCCPHPFRTSTSTRLKMQARKLARHGLCWPKALEQGVRLLPGPSAATFGQKNNRITPNGAPPRSVAKGCSKLGQGQWRREPIAPPRAVSSNEVRGIVYEHYPCTGALFWRRRPLRIYWLLTHKAYAPFCIPTHLVYVSVSMFDGTARETSLLFYPCITTI